MGVTCAENDDARFGTDGSIGVAHIVIPFRSAIGAIPVERAQADDGDDEEISQASLQSST